MKFVGRINSDVLFASEDIGIIVNEELNTVSLTDSIHAITASADWELDITDPKDVSYELANAAISSLDIKVFSSNDRLYTIPKSVQTEAKKSLEWHKEHHRGGTPVGLNTARTLAKGGQVGIRFIRHVAKYFPRHEVDKKGKGYKPGEDGFPSNGRIAWALWGGDAGKRWASAIVESENNKAKNASSYGVVASLDLDSFSDETMEFHVRVCADGSGIDRLYAIDNQLNITVWDDGAWSDLGASPKSFFEIDSELDAEPDGVIRYHLPVDSHTALVASATFDASPDSKTSIETINLEEAELVAAGMMGVDWEFIDSLEFANVYTPEERSKNAGSQVRDMTGKFAKGGSRVMISKNPAASGTVQKVNADNQTVDVKLDNGADVSVPANLTQAVPEDGSTSDGTSSIEPTFPNALDVSGILGEPRSSGPVTSATLPGRLPPLTGADMKTMLGDWSSWVADQNAGATAEQNIPQIPVENANGKVAGHMAPNAYNDPRLRSWLDTKASGKPGSTAAFPNKGWYNPIPNTSTDAKKSAKSVGTYKAPKVSGQGGSSYSRTSTSTSDGGYIVKTTTTKSSSSYSIIAAGAPQTPDTSKTPAIYMAIVAQDDPQAVMDLVALIPSTEGGTEPATFSRKNGKWVANQQVLNDLNSPTPPPVVVLDDETLKDVLSQVDSKNPAQTEPVTASIDEVLSIIWGPTGDLLAVIAAGNNKVANHAKGHTEGAEKLRLYWTVGKGAAKIRWGTKGDWSRCVRHLSKYLGPRAKGYCQLRHHDATGMYTATHAKLDKAGKHGDHKHHFSGGSGMEEPVYAFPVTNEDMAKSLKDIHAEEDHLYDDSWEPEEDIVKLLEDPESTLAITAAGDHESNKVNNHVKGHLEGAEKLRKYWTVGAGGAKIRWNTGGDWTRCVRHLSKYLGPRARGYCALRHKEMTGMWTGDKIHREMYGHHLEHHKQGGHKNFALYSDDFLRSSEEIIASAELSAQAKQAKSRIVASGAPDTQEGSRFHLPLVLPEEVESGDGRSFTKDAVTMRELPLPLMWQIKTAQGHDGSVVVGRIDKMERIEGGIGNAYGVFDSGEYGKEAERLIRGGFITGISADLDKFEASEEQNATKDGEEEKIGGGKIKITKGRIMGVTVVPKPAFQECKIYIVDEPTQNQEEPVLPDGDYVEEPADTDAEALVACAAVVASIPVTPPAEWFANPKLKTATPLTVTDDGRVFGHIAAWHVDHIGMSYGTKPPRSKSGYAYFHTGILRTEEGTDVPVGQLTLAGGHASLEASAQAAAKHYDDTGSAFADVHAGEDAYGIWVAGALRPSINPMQVRAIRASAPSGDWRPIKGALELVAVCQVNVPGFPIARARVASGEVMALVAAGARVLAEMKSDPVKELATRIERLEQAKDNSLLSAMEEVRNRFSSLKGEYIVSEEPIVADGMGDEEVQPLLVNVLQKLLSDVVSFYFRAHGYHWNVKGSDFSEYHELFGEIYEDVYDSIDPLAENIVKLGFEAPFNFGDFEALRTIQDSDVTSFGAIGLAYDLHESNDYMVQTLKSAFDACNSANEQGIANFLAERIDMHQKWAWQLGASLVPEDMEMPAEGADDQFFVTVFSTLDDRGLIATAGGPSEAVREELAKKGEALPDGSYPIRNVVELKKAIKAYGRSNPADRAKVRRHIQKRARALKSADLIPDEWKSLSTNGMELSIQVADLRSRIATNAITAAGEAGGVDPKALTPKGVSADESTLPNGVEQAPVSTAETNKFTAKTQPRDDYGKFREVLARLNQNIGDESLAELDKQLKETNKLADAGNYEESAKSAKDLINVLGRLDTKALDAKSLENVRLATTDLAKTISNLPLPFDNQAQKLRYSDLPPSLGNLMKQMSDKVIQKIGQKDGGVATQKIRDFMAGGEVFSQSDISKQMNILLRLLT